MGHHDCEACIHSIKVCEFYLAGDEVFRARTVSSFVLDEWQLCTSPVKECLTGVFRYPEGPEVCVGIDAAQPITLNRISLFRISSLDGFADFEVLHRL